MKIPYENLESRVRQIEALAHEKQAITFHEIIDILGPSSNYIITLFLVIPFLQPIPLFGLSTICGLMITWGGILTCCKHPVFLPKGAQKMSLSSQKILSITQRLLKMFDRTSRWTHERGGFVNQHTAIRLLNGLLFCVLGILLALPLPIPFTNTLPSLSLLLICLGSLRNDGFVLSSGYLVSATTLAYFSTITILPLKLMLD